MKVSVRMMTNGLTGIIFRAVDHENYYSFEMKGPEDEDSGLDGGFKRIRRYKNGVGKTLFKTYTNYLEDTWYTVLI